MALHATFIASLLASVTQAALSINCPILDCDEETTTMEPGKCFVHDGSVPTKKIQGRLCFDSETASVKATQYFCPFSYLQNEY